MTDKVVFKIEHEVDIGSDEATAIYAAVTNAMLNGGFMLQDSPLHFRVNAGVASLAYIDYESDVVGYHPIIDAVSELMVFDKEITSGDMPDAGREAEIIADCLEGQAARIRQRIKELTE